jgi:hypothetical protein
MKAFKYLPSFVAVILSSIFAEGLKKQSTAEYIQLKKGVDLWIEISNYSPVSCSGNNTQFCSYTLTDSLGLSNPTTKKILVLSGAVGHNFGLFYTID